MVSFCYFCGKITKNFKNFKTFCHFSAYLHIQVKSSIFAPDMSKRVVYSAPIDWMTGCISAPQSTQLTYGGGRGYEVAVGEIRNADSYEPRLIVKYRRRDGARYYQVRTRTSVHMSTVNKFNLAVMGGAGALFASLLRNKAASIYTQCVAVCPRRVTLRAFLVPLFRDGLRNKMATIAIADGVEVVNPWISSAAANVPVTQAVLDKFASELSNS